MKRANIQSLQDDLKYQKLLNTAFKDIQTKDIVSISREQDTRENRLSINIAESTLSTIVDKPSLAKIIAENLQLTERIDDYNKYASIFIKSVKNKYTTLEQFNNDFKLFMDQELGSKLVPSVNIDTTPIRIAIDYNKIKSLSTPELDSYFKDAFEFKYKKEPEIYSTFKYNVSNMKKVGEKSFPVESSEIVITSLDPLKFRNKGILESNTIKVKFIMSATNPNDSTKNMKWEGSLAGSGLNIKSGFDTLKKKKSRSGRTIYL